MKNFNLIEKQQELRKNTKQKRWLSRVISMLVLLLTLCVGNVWGETAVATSAGTYSFGSSNIGGGNKFAEISTNSVFIYRAADNYSTGKSGIKAVSGNTSGFVFYTTSPMTLSAGVYQNSTTAETVTIYVKSVTSAFFQNLVDGTATTTTISAPTLSNVGTFSVVGSTTKQEYSGTYGSTLPAGYYYVYAQTTAGSCNTYHRSITLTSAAVATTWYVKGGWNSWGTTDNFKGSGTEVSATVNITTAGSYEFKIWNNSGGDGTWYGNTGNIGCNVSGWEFATGKDNCKFFASETGNYIFTFNTSTKALSVTYPTAQGKYYYKNTSSWGSVAVYRYVGGINNGWPGTIVTETETVCGDTYYVTYADPGTTLIFNNNNGGSQTGDMAASGNAGKYVAGTGSSWTAFTYNVTYDKNGGTGTAPTDATNYSSGASVPVKDNSNLTKSGYYFAGWNTKADGSGDTYVLGQTFSITSCTTLYAKWNAVSCPDGSVEGTVFSLTSPTGTVSVAANSSATITSSQATVSKGLATLVNGQGSAKSLINSSKFSLPNGNTVIRLNLGCALAVGDVISFADANYKFMVSKTNSTSPGTNNFVVQPSKTENCTIPAGSNLIGLKEVFVVRAESSTTTCTAITITRPAGCDAPSALAAATPTAKGITLTVTDANDVNNYEFYVSTSSTAPEAGATATHSVSSAKSLTITNLVAGTTYYAWARTKCSSSNKSDWVALTGNTFTTSTVTVTHTLTNVDKTSGETTAGGSAYEAVYAAASGYSLPTPTVTIDGNTATSGTDYTWTAGTGTISIPAAKITGDIVITLNSATAAPTSVAIGTQFHYFPGNTITLTATPTGGNGPKTYQWYHGGTADGNAIDGARSATYTKANCEYSDAGSYYCKVTCGGSLSRTSSNFDVKILRLYVNGSRDGDAYGNVDFASTGDDATATASISLGSGWTYGFSIADGCGNYYGNSGTMTEANHSNWTMDRNNSGQCAITTTNAATYTFTVTYYENSAFILGAPKVSVSYPAANQAADKVIYFDNSVLSWAVTPYYRIGHSTHSQATVMTKVSGTANLYKVTTTEYNGFSGWFIANAEGGTGSDKSIYNTVNTPAITKATAHEGGAVTADAVTVSPTTSKGAGADAGVNDNCEFFNYTITTGMKIDRVTITAPTNGTITVNYTNTSGSSANFTSGYADLAHTCIITPTATPLTGYKLSGLTVNASAHTSGSAYTVTGATTVAATFAAKQSAITFDKNGGTGGATGTTGTYGSAMTTVTIPTRLGYTFDGYWDAETANDGSGTKYYNADGTSARTWDKNTESATTLYAKWVAVECPAAGSGETVYKFVPVTSSSDNVASSSGAELTTSDYLSALVNGHVYAYGSSASNVTMTSSGVKVASSTGYLKLDFDCALIAGDQIKWKSDQNSINLCNTTSYNSSNDLTLAKSNSSYSTVDITSAMVGKQTLYLVYNTGVATMIYFEIIRPEGYSVTYKANGGTGSDVNRIDATAASLATVGFTRAGYDFTGWKTGESSGTDYAVGDDVPSALTLYAQWSCVTPTIGTDLSTSQVDYEQDATASALTVAATANGTGGNGTVGYQWYSNTANSTTTPAPTILTGKTSASYTPSTEDVGTTYYFCRVTNTSSGCATTTDSKIAKIVVSEAPCFKFSCSSQSDKIGAISSGGSITASLWDDATLTGGTMTNSSSESLNVNKTYGLVMESGKEVTVTLAAGSSLEVGSVIKLSAGVSDASGSQTSGLAINGNACTPPSYTSSTAGAPFTQTYTVTALDGLAGTNTFTVAMKSDLTKTYLNGITVTGCADCTPIDPELSYSKTTLWMDDADLTATPSLDKDVSTGTVSYALTSATPSGCVTLNTTTGVVTAVKRGTATITATIEADGTHCGKSVSSVITVKDKTCGYTEIASAVLTSKTAATTVNATLLASNMSNSSAPYKLDKTLPSYFGLQLSSGNFQVGDSVIFKVKINDMNISGYDDYPVAFYHTTDTSSYTPATAIYIARPNTKNTDNVYIRFIVTKSMIDAGLTNKILIIRSGRVKQNHSMYEARIKRYACPDIFIYDDAAGTHEWSDDDNWIGAAGHGSGLPTSEDRVFINESVTVDVATAAAAELHITNGSMVTVEKSITVGDVNIETGSTLNVAKDGESGITVATNSLYLKGGWNSSYTSYDMPRIYIDPASTLTKVVNTVNLDISVDSRNYYPIAVPFKVKVSDVDYANSTLASFSNYGANGQYVIKDYDGERRAENGPDQVNNWKVVPQKDEKNNDVYLEPGRGYIMTAISIPSYGGGVIRFPMSFTNDWTAEGEQGTVDAVTKNVVAVKAYEGAATAGDKKVNKGWNLLGVPFMSCYATSEVDNKEAVIQGRYDFMTNTWIDGTIRYVNVPSHDFAEYIQSNVTDPETVLRPGWCFMVQIEETGELTFLAAGKDENSDLPIYAPKRGVKADMPTVKTGIILSDGEKSDKTTFLVSDKYNGAEYEINADLEKMFGNGYTLATYSLSGTTRLAYNALGNADAANIIPIGYRAPADGEYTFSINPRYAENGAFESVNLIDYETGIVTDLLKFSYTFSTERTQNDTRFALNVVKQKETPTDIELVGGDAQVDGPRKLLLDGKMYIILDGKMFDAQGKRVQ